MDDALNHNDSLDELLQSCLGLKGFRQSHLDAVVAQRMVSRLQSDQQIVRFSDVELVALVTADPERAEQFLHRTLGDMITAHTDLRRTLLTYINEQSNATKAAELLFTHRNTVLRRVARAQQLLPTSLEERAIPIAVALQVLQWRSDEWTRTH